MSEPTISTSTSWRIEKWFPDLQKETQSLLQKYNEELIKFNKTLNLVSPKTIPFADIIHFSDCILASKIIFESHPGIDHIYDLGSGNGFPGMVFAILYPKIKVTLVDSDQRKCEFLKHAASQLSLSNVAVQNITVESIPANTIKYCMTRGFASLSRSLLLTRKAVQPGGIFFHLKADNWSAEVSQIPTQLCSLWSPSLISEYQLPAGEIKYAIVKTEKIS